MSGENYTNTASVATTAAPMGPSDLTVVVASYSGFPTAPYWAELEKGTASAEIVRVTNVAGTTLTITRGQGGTAATSHGAGVNVEHVVPASHFNEGETHNAATTAHGVTGVVVGTQGAQTVQDKNFRGAFRADYTDALPAGITSSFESNANSAAARDGFVHKNTAGHADRRGFLLQQSGTDRVQVFNDGTVDLDPGASARPGFRNHGTTQLDGAVTADATVTATGAAILNGGLTVVGASGLQAVTATTISATSTIHANGSIDTDTNLTVDGTSTLTGAVTAGGALSAASLAATNAVTGATGAFTSQVTSYGGRVVPSVTVLPGSPVDGQVVYKADEVMFYRYSTSGGAWGRWMPFVPRAELRQTTLQTLGSGAWTDITFQAEDLDTHNGHAASAAAYVVPAGWTGTLQLEGGVGFAADTGTSRGARWAKNGAAIARGAKTVANSSTINLAVDARTIKVPVVPGDSITLQGWQNKGSNVDTDTTAENQSYMSVTWLYH